MLNWWSNIPLKNPLLILLNNPLFFFLGFCSAAWLRGPERTKLANSLEDLNVWVLLVISDFTRRHRRVILATTTAFHGRFHSAISLWSVSRREPTFIWKYLNSTGSTWGRASSTCGWKKSENSSWRSPRAQKQVRCEQFAKPYLLLVAVSLTVIHLCNCPFLCDTYAVYNNYLDRFYHSKFAGVLWSNRHFEF